MHGLKLICVSKRGPWPDTPMIACKSCPWNSVILWTSSGTYIYTHTHIYIYIYIYMRDLGITRIKNITSIKMCGWNYLSIPNLQRFHLWSLGMDKLFLPTLYRACDHLSKLGLQLIHTGKVAPGGCHMSLYMIHNMHMHIYNPSIEYITKAIHLEWNISNLIIYKTKPNPEDYCKPNFIRWTVIP